jgi:hypothetical protein
MSTRNRMIVLVAGLFSATLMVAAQTGSTVHPANDHMSPALAAGGCPNPTSAKQAANAEPRSSPREKKAQDTNSQRPMPIVNDPSANDQPLETQQSDQNKSPWWEPRDWNYINSF